MTQDTDRLLGQLLERTDILGREVGDLKESIGRLTDNHHTRIAALELKSAEMKGGTRVLLILGSISAALGGVIVTILGKLFPH